MRPDSECGTLAVPAACFGRNAFHAVPEPPAMNHPAAVYPIDPDFAAKALVTREDYERQYAESVRDPAAFWGKVADRLDWFAKPTKIKDVSFDLEDFRIRWYEDGELNASVNCLDRHLATRGDKTALIFEHDDPSRPAEHITYRDLHARVCKLANALRSLGVRKATSRPPSCRPPCAPSPRSGAATAPGRAPSATSRCGCWPAATSPGRCRAGSCCRPSPRSRGRRPWRLTRLAGMTDLSADLDAEDAKLVTLARATRARARALEGAAVRDLDGRTYAAASVRLPHLSLSALEVCVAMAISSGSSGLEAAVVLTDGDTVDLAAAGDFAGPDVPVLVGGVDGRVHTRQSTPAPGA
jgi:hypothetical protein